jgi:hypothetical protein
MAAGKEVATEVPETPKWVPSERYLYNGDGEESGFAIYGRPGNQEDVHKVIRSIEGNQHIRSYPTPPCTQVLY